MARRSLPEGTTADGQDELGEGGRREAGGGVLPRAANCVTLANTPALYGDACPRAGRASARDSSLITNRGPHHARPPSRRAVLWSRKQSETSLGLLLVSPVRGKLRPCPRRCTARHSEVVLARNSTMLHHNHLSKVYRAEIICRETLQYYSLLIME